ncbi:MAG: hypothetical protein QXK39_04575, partial [Nitrososphaerota archaeon]
MRPERYSHRARRHLENIAVHVIAVEKAHQRHGQHIWKNMVSNLQKTKKHEENITKNTNSTKI